MDEKQIDKLADEHLRYQTSDYGSSGIYNFARAVRELALREYEHGKAKAANDTYDEVQGMNTP